MRGKSEKGFTLAELIIAVCLIGLIALLVLPRIGLGTSPMRAASRQLIGMMRTLQLTASTDKRPYRLYLDLDQQAYWAVVVQPDGERPPAVGGLSERIALPPEVRLLDIITPALGKVVTARAAIQFTPGGRTERGLLHLGEEGGNVMTLMLNPLTGGIRTEDGYVDPPRPEPLPENLKLVFFPMVPR
jgi:prepilin-type N-terminal cleavage/methylation domain-containing protein